jgi:hypothetical protein
VIRESPLPARDHASKSIFEEVTKAVAVLVLYDIPGKKIIEVYDCMSQKTVGRRPGKASYNDVMTKLDLKKASAMSASSSSLSDLKNRSGNVTGGR